MKSDLEILKSIQSDDKSSSFHLVVPPKSLKTKFSRNNVIPDGISNLSSTSRLRSRNPNSEHGKTDYVTFRGENTFTSWTIWNR